MTGFTLIETIIAIVVIGIMFFGLIAVFTGVFTSVTRDESVTISGMLARQEMERVVESGFANIVDEHRDSPSSFGGNFNNYLWQVRVDAVPVSIANDTGMADYKQIEVRVSNAIAGDVSLKTMVTNY
jgi:prepilin-type N-terminal cleavage/methylation domain-containing protein